MRTSMNPPPPIFPAAGFDYRQRKRGCHRGVHRIAAALQNLHAGARSELFVRRDHAVSTANRFLRPGLSGICASFVFRGSLRAQ